jgi:hypothetical protein
MLWLGRTDSVTSSRATRCCRSPFGPWLVDVRRVPFRSRGGERLKSPCTRKSKRPSPVAGDGLLGSGRLMAWLHHPDTGAATRPIDEFRWFTPGVMITKPENHTALKVSSRDSRSCEKLARCMLGDAARGIPSAICKANGAVALMRRPRNFPIARGIPQTAARPRRGAGAAAA